MNEFTQREDSLKRIVIVGGGTAGWMAAAAFSKALANQNTQVVLVESDQIGTIGVGEATIPPIVSFNRILGLDEDEFVKATNASFKLGIEFVDWSAPGEHYMHPFGAIGATLGNQPFYAFWQKLYQMGKAPDVLEYSLNTQACYQNRFMRPANIANSPLSTIAYAFHFDASLYAKYLRKYAEERGVQRVEGLISKVNQDGSSGFIESVQLESGQIVDGDFFVDCSGFRGVLIEQALDTGYEDWSHYLPCNSAIAIPSERLSVLPPYTRATAHSAGWQWRIPLQHRTGNGHVYCNEYVSDEEAQRVLLDNLETPATDEPRLIRFQTGKRRKHWNKNCIALGLASGFLEPLESTSIHLIQEGILKFLALFPGKDYDQVIVDKYNQQLNNAFTFVRDLLILHYHVTSRDDSPFWNFCRTMDIPDTLQAKLDLYESSARIFRENDELFNEISWLTVMHGQGLRARTYNPLIDTVPQADLEKQVQHVQQTIDKCAEAMPLHDAFIDEHCKATM
jgi:tryptophan halogenase